MSYHFTIVDSNGHVPGQTEVIPTSVPLPDQSGAALMALIPAGSFQMGGCGSGPAACPHGDPGCIQNRRLRSDQRPLRRMRGRWALPTAVYPEISFSVQGYMQTIRPSEVYLVGKAANACCELARQHACPPKPSGERRAWRAGGQEVSLGRRKAVCTPGAANRAQIFDASAMARLQWAALHPMAMACSICSATWLSGSAIRFQENYYSLSPASNPYRAGHWYTQSAAWGSGVCPASTL